ncbi:hypothetical protein Ddye_024013 [Dipteronia dyeriana]|uniref:Uncharacterized protein n=1 Tax=Dipteronia dyeriana TaxID=168575 RepID=A0AAD9TUY6_9ROSI|nr:hypothetical protein Ddye_024013 [Dipteronia dyeriana]
MKNLHLLLITCSAQGHINPTLQLAKRLLCGGVAKVTFATTVHGLSKMKTLPSHDGLSYASFSDALIMEQSLMMIPTTSCLSSSAQSASAFAIYYHFFDTHEVIPYFREHIQNLEKDRNPCVLLNTFDALEEEAIKNVANNINLISIGPLVPSHNKPAGCDLFEASKQYIEWLNTKPDRSVVYVSFGSLAVLQRKQMEEIFHGLVSTGIPFLWVIRSLEDDDDFKAMIIISGLFRDALWVEFDVGELSCRGAGGRFPQFSDQLMNAKMVEDLWGTGIRARVNHEEEDGIVKREEIKRCVEVVMGLDGEKGEEIRKNAAKWRGLSVIRF